MKQKDQDKLLTTKTIGSVKLNYYICLLEQLQANLNDLQTKLKSPPQPLVIEKLVNKEVKVKDSAEINKIKLQIELLENENKDNRDMFLRMNRDIKSLQAELDMWLQSSKLEEARSKLESMRIEISEWKQKFILKNREHSSVSEDLMLKQAELDNLKKGKKITTVTKVQILISNFFNKTTTQTSKDGEKTQTQEIKSENQPLS